MRARLSSPGGCRSSCGCGDDAPPDEATSRAQVEKVVLDWHRAQAAGDGEAGCRLLTDKQQAATVESDRKTAAAIGTISAGSCVEAVAKYAGFSEFARQVFLNTRVDAVRIDGERATATAHTSGTRNGVTRQTQPVNIPLLWDHGRWLID